MRNLLGLFLASVALTLLLLYLPRTKAALAETWALAFLGLAALTVFGGLYLVVYQNAD
jgi:hypothetical protein